MLGLILETWNILTQLSLNEKSAQIERQKNELYAEMERLLDAYEENRPALDEETRTRVKAALVNGCGIDIEQLNAIDRL